MILEEPVCDLCGGAERAELWRTGDFRLGIPMPEYGVCQCRRCGLAYLSPRPDTNSIGQCYPKGYDSRRSFDQRNARRRYERQASFVGTGQGGALDVGTAKGDFLPYLSKLGYTAIGIDPFPRDDDRSGNIPTHILHCTIDSEALPAGGFDLITASCS